MPQWTLNLTLHCNCERGAKGGLSKSPNTDKLAQLYYLQCTKAMEIYYICMFYMNKKTICPILTGIHIKCIHISNAYIYTVQNMFLNFRWFMFDLRYASVDLKPYVTSAPHKYWFYLHLIHASHCQKNFPNVYKTRGVTFQSESCLGFLNGIFKVQVLAKVVDSVL